MLPDVGTDDRPPAALAMSRSWRLAVAALAAGLAAIVVVFWDTTASMVDLWWTRSSYNYAFLILPISLYLVWLKRRAVLAHTPRPSMIGVAVLAVCAAAWLVADLATINVGRHLAIVGMIVAYVLSVVGWRAVRSLAFPLAYLMLLVPVGEFALPLLQDIATVLSSWMIEASGVPIYVEGVFIEVPTGLYYVAPGCAGLNFLLAGLAVSPLYAYLMYRGIAKRLAAVAVMLAVTIAANAVRIAAIILIAHYSEQKLSIVDDHILYGWGFFAIILFALAIFGARFADPAPGNDEAERGFDGQTSRPVPMWRALVPVLAIAIVVTGPVLASGLQAARPSPISQPLTLPGSVGNWTRVHLAPTWMPAYQNADAAVGATYQRSEEPVTLFLVYYQAQPPGRELVSDGNQIADAETWAVLERGRHRTVVDGRPLAVEETLVRSGSERRRIWHWYWIDGQFTSSRLEAKLLEAKTELLSGDRRAALVAVSAEEGLEPEAARRVLQAFVDDAPVRAWLDGTSDG